MGHETSNFVLCIYFLVLHETKNSMDYKFYQLFFFLCKDENREQTITNDDTLKQTLLLLFNIYRNVLNKNEF